MVETYGWLVFLAAASPAFLATPRFMYSIKRSGYCIYTRDVPWIVAASQGLRLAARWRHRFVKGNPGRRHIGISLRAGTIGALRSTVNDNGIRYHKHLLPPPLSSISSYARFFCRFLYFVVTGDLVRAEAEVWTGSAVAG